MRRGGHAKGSASKACERGTSNVNADLDHTHRRCAKVNRGSRIAIVIGAVLIAVLTAGTASASFMSPHFGIPVQEDYLIVPGERIGPYRLGETRSRFVDAWGDEDLLPGHRDLVREWMFAVKPFGFGVAFCHHDDRAASERKKESGSDLSRKRCGGFMELPREKAGCSLPQRITFQGVCASCGNATWREGTR